MTVCDTTSALSGKKRAYNLFKKSIEIRECAHIFNNACSTVSMIVSVGERFLLAVYGAPKTTKSPKVHIYHSFTGCGEKSHTYRTTAGTITTHLMCCRTTLNASIPPVQQWLSPGPDNIMNSISCNCKSGCGSTCGCRKAYRFSILCDHCHGAAYKNCQEVELDSSDDEEIRNYKKTLLNSPTLSSRIWMLQKIIMILLAKLKMSWASLYEQDMVVIVDDDVRELLVQRTEASKSKICNSVLMLDIKWCCACEF
jgi:hypothetical protein